MKFDGQYHAFHFSLGNQTMKLFRYFDKDSHGHDGS
jgi:hypothetical protein